MTSKPAQDVLAILNGPQGDEIAERVGKALVDAFMLQPDPVLKQLYDTDRGYKTACGLARVAAEVIAETLEDSR